MSLNQSFISDFSEYSPRKGLLFTNENCLSLIDEVTVETTMDTHLHCASKY